MATLKIIRPSAFVGRAMGINIIIDGVKVGKIANNTQQQYEVSAGDHTMKCNQGMFKITGSEEFQFNISENETRTLVVKYAPVVVWSVSIITAILAASNRMIADRLGIDPFVSLLVVILIMLALMFILRNKQMTISDFLS